MKIVDSSNDPLDRLNYSLETMLCWGNVVMKNAEYIKKGKRRKEKKVIKRYRGTPVIKLLFGSLKRKVPRCHDLCNRSGQHYSISQK